MKTSGSNVLSVAVAIISGLMTLQALWRQSDDFVSRWAWSLGTWIIAKFGPPLSFVQAPAFAVATLVGLTVYGCVYLLLWRLEIWAAGKRSEISGKALSKTGGLSVEDEMKKLIRRHGS